MSPMGNHTGDAAPTRGLERGEKQEGRGEKKMREEELARKKLPENRWSGPLKPSNPSTPQITSQGCMSLEPGTPLSVYGLL